MKGKTKMYLDNGATTQLDSRVLETMFPVFTEYFGNASSLYSYGTKTKQYLEHLRLKFAGFINAQSDEIIFTSGGTEANNLALKGIAFANKGR